jgi:hypothetical protein
VINKGCELYYFLGGNIPLAMEYSQTLLVGIQLQKEVLEITLRDDNAPQEEKGHFILNCLFLKIIFVFVFFSEEIEKELKEINESVSAMDDIFMCLRADENLMNHISGEVLKGVTVYQRIQYQKSSSICKRVDY